MNMLAELESENKKTGLFSGADVTISYMLGFPILDQQLGGIYKFTLPDGTTMEQTQLGVQAGTFTMVTGPSSSGKTTATMQMVWNIVEPFGEDAIVLHFDGEHSTKDFRVRSVLGIDNYTYTSRYKLISDNNTWEDILAHLVDVGKKKESNKARYKYKTGKLDSNGNEIEYYIPTCVIIDSLMKITSKNEELDTISGAMSGGREAVARGKFYRNALDLLAKYNINVFVINHFADEMPAIGGQQKAKELTFIPTGKMIPGGRYPKFYSSAIILFQPVNAKDQLKTVEVNGYNGLPVKTLVIKSRSSAGGVVAQQELIQESGFDMRLTLMNFAKEKNLIVGRNPSSYFACNPDVKFDTRCFIDEIRRDGEIIRTLFRECKPELMKLVPTIDCTEKSDDVLSGAKFKKESRDLMREMFAC
jgi:RecA/RadA recombinase